MHRRCPQTDPPADSITDFCCLLLAYRWERNELERCGVKEGEFFLILCRLREELVKEGFIEEGDF